MAEQRKYSIAEIDAMRSYLSELCTPYGVGYIASDLEKTIERRLRTHMLNGTEPDELRIAAQEKVAQYIAAMERRRHG